MYPPMKKTHVLMLQMYIPTLQAASNAWRVKVVLFEKNNEYESAWDNRGNTKLNQTKLQKHNYQ